MIDHNHPAVKAAHFASLGKSTVSGQTWTDALAAALPHLESATEDNLARLRTTPAGKQLLAEGWEAACRKVIHMAWADSFDAEHLANEGNPYRT